MLSWQGAHGFIPELAEAYDTRIDERAVQLTGDPYFHGDRPH